MAMPVDHDILTGHPGPDDPPIPLLVSLTYFSHVAAGKTPDVAMYLAVMHHYRPKFRREVAAAEARAEHLQMMLDGRERYVATLQRRYRRWRDGQTARGRLGRWLGRVWRRLRNRRAEPLTWELLRVAGVILCVLVIVTVASRLSGR